MPCPPLDRWLAPQWKGRAVAVTTTTAAKGWTPPRGLRKWIAREGVEALPAEPARGSVEVLLVLSTLRSAAEIIEDAPWQALRPGGVLIDLGVIPSPGLGGVLRPWVHARQLRVGSATRMSYWLRRGAFAPEQWIAVSPADIVVTMVKRAIRSGRCVSAPDS